MAAPWAMVVTLAGIHVEAVAQADPGRLRHDHHPVRQRGHLVQHATADAASGW